MKMFDGNSDAKIKDLVSQARQNMINHILDNYEDDESKLSLLRTINNMPSEDIIAHSLEHVALHDNFYIQLVEYIHTKNSQDMSVDEQMGLGV